MKKVKKKTAKKKPLRRIKKKPPLNPELGSNAYKRLKVRGKHKESVSNCLEDMIEGL